MKFTLSAKPLKTVTELGIIKANVSPFFRRSSLVQLTANRDTLKINIQAASIKTRMELKGSGDEDKEVAICVDCLIFKNLINSIDNDVIALEFVDNGLYIHAGNSKFAIPQMSDVSEAMLEEPVSQYNAKSSVVIQPADWQFVKDHQMFAIAVKEEHPVYRNVWVGSNKEVLVGDFDISLFTFSKKGNFLNSCLLTPSLINLFTAIPEGATVSMIDRNYVLSIETDSYSMVTEFLPKYEDDESVGSYNSQVFLNMMKHPESFITVDINPITKFIQQTAILGVQGSTIDNGKKDAHLYYTVADNKLVLSTTVDNNTSSCTVPVNTKDNYTILFSWNLLKSVLFNMDSDKINMAPIMRDYPNGDTVEKRAIGGIFWTDDLTVLLAGMG